MANLRDYQREAVDVMLADRNVPGNSILVLGTAAGKSHIIAHYVRESKEPALILCPNREILTQNRAKLKAIVDPDEVGTYSASMKEKTIKPYTFATIGSIFRKTDLFDIFRTVIVDECHTVRPDKYDSMYISFFENSKATKIFGLTASPYINVSTTRFLNIDLNDNGKWYCSETRMYLLTTLKNKFWDRIIFNYDAKKLRENGYTVPVKYYDYHFIQPDCMRLNSARTDYDQDTFARQMNIYSSKLAEVCIGCMEKHVSTLVFCANVAQAQVLKDLVPGSEMVTGKTPAKKREDIIKRYVAGDIKILFNVSCLTTGFDSPRTDCLVILRPTKSIGLYQQFIGRGVRLSPETNKTFCRVIDLSGTHYRLGSAEEIRLVPECGSYQLVGEKEKIKNGMIIGSYEFKVKY